ncbi:lysoplasmalogenase [Streptomyces sp. NE06-03E]|uniref:lysoplasmalogenase n=1 Tax=Streptomyces sp. NE06-03E TaxID=3028695 RepID=UPI0029A8AC4F|nr:lysoplasmalogenase [Streptomyces sp. NE06-03E]MDX3058127.1 lysoplasmalogenase [Streptomyces sp. NE06-03E]
MTPRAGAPRLVRPLLVAFLAVATVDLAGLLAGLQTAHLLAKPLLMPLLAATAAARGGPRLLVAALLFGWGGDVLLMPGSDAAFLAGMACFAAGHVCYLVLFGHARLRPAAGLLYAAALVAFLVHLWPGLPAELKVPLTGYSLLLAAMAWRAGALGRYAAVGGALFLLSDALIATGIADRPQLPAHDFWIMLTYLAAQYLLTRGVLGGTADSTGAAPGAYREGSIRI